MNQLEMLEKIIEMGKEISRSKGKDVFLYYLREMRLKGFNKEFFELLLLKYNLLRKEYLDIMDMLNKREIIDLLITSILHPN